MRHRPTAAFHWLAAGFITLTAGQAWAGRPSDGPITEIESSASRPLVAFGEPAHTCSWPTVVAVIGAELCTGTLIHPDIVIYSGSCGYDDKVIRFGEDAFFAGREVEAEYCSLFPQGNSAYCKLAQPITDLPVTPLLLGCDFDQVSEGDAAVLVGFGATETDMVSRQKHWGLTSLAAIDRTSGWFKLEDIGDAPFGCADDAGAPVFVQLDDGSWRVAGIVSSTSGTCTGNGTFIHDLIEYDMPWLDTSLQITPCHSWDGSWAPSPACTGFYAQSPDLANGTWNDWCLGTPAIGDAATCGPSWDDFDPSLPPEVEIQSPISGETLEPGAIVEIEILAQRQPDGFTLRQVGVEINGSLLATQQAESFYSHFQTQPLPQGSYSIIAFVEDWAGNIAWSEAVEIDVDVDAPELGGDENPKYNGPSPCAVGASHPHGWWLWLLGLGFWSFYAFKRQHCNGSPPHQSHCSMSETKPVNHNSAISIVSTPRWWCASSEMGSSHQGSNGASARGGQAADPQRRYRLRIHSM
jgi:hypothetical protein